MMQRKLLGLVLVGSLLHALPAAACDEAEKLRLSDEAKKLAQRNAWAGVERGYEALLATKCELAFDDHFLGSQAAKFLGKTFEVYERLGAARLIDQRSEIVEEMESILGTYGMIEIKGDPRFRPELSREAMPFAPDQRKSIEYAIEVVANTGSFKGMLPRGEYVVGEQTFTVEPGDQWQVLEVGKVKGRGEDQPLVRYANVVALVGPNFLTTPQPTEPTVDGAGQHQFSPSGVFGGGLGVQVGTELGLGYRSPDAGIALTVGYQGAYGNNNLHQLTGWAAGLIRPGEWRVALGPTYSVVLGRGTGVADWFDVGQDPQQDPVEDIRYQGAAWGGGLQGAAGYGVLDLEKLRGLVELTGAWQYDGARSYVGFGLRVGIVPAVPRFKG